MLGFVIFAVTFVVALVLAVLWLHPGKSRTSVPGLEPSCIETGNLGDIGQAGSLHEFLLELHEKFGPISGFWWGKTYVLSIASPELMSQHYNVFDRPVLLFKSFELLLGPKSIQYANGSDGKTRRRTYDRCFGFDSMEKYLYYFNECADKVETDWLSKTPDDHIPLFENCFLYAIHAAALSILGDYYKDDAILLQFKDSYEEVWTGMENFLFNPSVMEEESKKVNFDKALSFLKDSIKKAISYRKQHELHLKENQLIDVLICSSEDEETLISDAISYMVGSFHTTGNLLTWALYYVAAHPEVQDKLHTEVKAVLGQNDQLDKNNFSQMVYMNQVIDETLRCAVIAPWAARFKDEDSELGGYQVPKNTPVIHALGVLSKDQKLWPEPNKFDPDRFSPEKQKSVSSYMFVPFGFAGKRKCPAYRFAYWDAAVLLATIVRRFEVCLVPNQEVKPVYGLVTHPKDEIWVTIKKR